MAHRESIRAFLKDVKLDGLKVIDWGCGTKPIKNYLFGAKEYLGLDKLTHVNADIVGNIDEKEILYKLPHFMYDVAFCIEVLEHVRYPKILLDNIFSSLKPNGTLYMSVPFLYDVHSEEDYWRFTDQGLKFLLEKSGFKIELINPTEDRKGWVLKAIKG